MPKALKPKRVVRRRKSRRAKRGTLVTQKGGTICYRSGWEKEFAEWLDASPDVRSFEYERLIIPYMSNARSKKVRRYFPDFFVHYVDGHSEVIEIKPARRVHQARNMKKSIAAGDWCRTNGHTYKIFTEKELKALGLLKKPKKV